jgi:hypothetical protein
MKYSWLLIAAILMGSCITAQTNGQPANPVKTEMELTGGLRNYSVSSATKIFTFKGVNHPELYLTLLRNEFLNESTKKLEEELEKMSAADRNKIKQDKNLYEINLNRAFLMYANDPDNKVGLTSDQITQMCVDIANTIEKGDLGVMFIAKLKENKVNLELLILVAPGTHVSKEQQAAMNNLLDTISNQIRQTNPASLGSASRQQ